MLHFCNMKLGGKSQSPFGMHMMLDAYDAPFKQLDDMKIVYKFLYNLPDMIGMSRLTTPMVVNAEESATGKDPGGISGFVMINESHISIHTFAKKGFFTFDLYSCNEFNDQVETILKYIKKNFPYRREELQIVKRGLKY